jgi:hypothetical protein
MVRRSDKVILPLGRGVMNARWEGGSRCGGCEDSVDSTISLCFAESFLGVLRCHVAR